MALLLSRFHSCRVQNEITLTVVALQSFEGKKIVEKSSLNGIFFWWNGPRGSFIFFSAFSLATPAIPAILISKENVLGHVIDLNQKLEIIKTSYCCLFWLTKDSCPGDNPAGLERVEHCVQCNPCPCWVLFIIQELSIPCWMAFTALSGCLNNRAIRPGTGSLVRFTVREFRHTCP